MGRRLAGAVGATWLVGITAILAGCAPIAGDPPGATPAGPPTAANPARSVALDPLAGASGSPGPSYVSIAPIPIVPKPTMPPWFAMEMTDVTTGKTFRISDFTGKVVLLETMAVWCPTCQGEMSQVQQLPDLVGASRDDLVRVALDVDPNEDAAILAKFAAKNGFDWYIAVAPTEVARFLATNYDVAYLNPPLLPMLFIDRSGGVYGLPTGIKSAVSLQKTLAQYLAQ